MTYNLLFVQCTVIAWNYWRDVQTARLSGESIQIGMIGPDPTVNHAPTMKTNDTPCDFILFVNAPVNVHCVYYY